MKRLVDKVNVNPANPVYPYGQFRDDPGDGTGTPVSVEFFTDIVQTFEKIFAESGMTANGVPDNQSNGWQLFEAMKTTLIPFKDWIGSVSYDVGGFTTVPFLNSLPLESSLPFAWDGINQSLLTCLWEDTSYTLTDPSQYDVSFQILEAKTGVGVQKGIFARLVNVTCPGPGILKVQIRFYNADGSEHTMNNGPSTIRIAVRRKL